MKKLFSYFDHIIPAYFLISIMSNIMSYYITGNRFEIVRKFASWGIIFLLNIVTFFVFFHLWKKYKTSRKIICLVSIPFVLILLLITSALFKANFNSYVIKEWICFILYCFPAFVIAIYVVLEKKIRILISNFKWIGLISLPFFSQYIIQSVMMAIMGEYSNQFAGVVYLTISYSAFTILSFCAMDLFIISMKHEQENYRRNRTVDLLNIVICSLTVAVVGSRGVFVALLCWYILMIVTVLTKKCRNRSVTCALIIIPLCVIMTIFITETANQGSNRIAGLMREVDNNEFGEALGSEESKKLTEKLSQDSNSGLSFEESVSEMEGSAAESITNGGMARVYLYKLAIREANNKCLIGLGPLGYQLKYGIYPHNIVLECLSDYGYVVTILFVIFILYLIKLLYLYSRVDICYLCALILSLAQGVEMMFSGDLYVEPFLIWIVTFVLALKLKEINSLENKNNV